MSVPENKYRLVKGVLRYSPRYLKIFQKKGGSYAGCPTERALAYVSDAEDFRVANSMAKKNGTPACQLTSETSQNIASFASGDLFDAAGMQCTSPKKRTAGLLKRLKKYKAPVGMVNRLEEISGRTLIFVVDDSTEMNLCSNGQKGRRRMTRWRESEFRLKRLMEIVAYMPVPRVEIAFFNRPEHVVITRRSCIPRKFYQEASKHISKAFAIAPLGETSAYESVQEILKRASGKGPSALYLLSTIAGAGGPFVRQRTYEMISSTAAEEDIQTSYLFKGPSCADCEPLFDDIAPEFDTAQESASATHGASLPYTFGMWLVDQLTGHTSSSLTECATSQQELENIVGVHLTPQIYHDYVKDAVIQPSMRAAGIVMPDAPVSFLHESTENLSGMTL